MDMERRRSFQWSVGLVAWALATALSFTLLRLLPPDSAVAALALSLLYAGAIAGFDRLLALLLPPVLARLLPSLDAGSS